MEQLPLISNGLTIADFLALRESSMEELCGYAKLKGINLPSDPNHVLSPSELKTIDPDLYNELRYGEGKHKEKETVSPHKEESAPSEISRTDSAETLKPRPSVVGKIDLERLNEKARKPMRDKAGVKGKNARQTAPKRIIGIVKFFDAIKGWGFVVAGIKDIGVEYKGTLFSLHLTAMAWKGASSPLSREWVTLTPLKTAKGWRALDVSPMECDRETLLLAMKYRGKFARIEGTNKEDSFNENILCHIIDGMLPRGWRSSSEEISEKCLEVIDCFCQYVVNMPKEHEKSIVAQFLFDEKLKMLLLELFGKVVYQPTDERKRSAAQLFKNALVEDRLKKGKLSCLAKLPAAFDLSPLMDRVTPLLINEAIVDPVGVESWLTEHDYIGQIYLSNRNCRTIPLRFILEKLTNDRSWIEGIDADWSDVRDFIRENSTSAYSYCKRCFLGKDEEFRKTHEVADLLDKETLRAWISELMEEEEIPVILLRQLLEHNIIGYLDLWCRFVQKGLDIAPSYPHLRAALNDAVLTDAESVRGFLEQCGEEGIPAQSIFGEEEGFRGEMYLTLFVVSGDSLYLSRINGWEEVISWVNGQSHPFILDFIRAYGQWLADNGMVDTSIDLAALDFGPVAEALKEVSDEEQLSLLRYFPKDYGVALVADFFPESKLFELYIGEQWAELKKGLPYMAFDIESDGDTIREAAFRSAGTTHYSVGEDDLSELTEMINSTPIVVGHRIKQWDLKVLEKKAGIRPAFVWDTLEIEILLNPCRYAYALLTGHNAKEDTELTERLFWNQLFRLASDEELWRSSHGFLPPNLSGILSRLREPWLTDYYKRFGDGEDDFFQNLHDIDESLTRSLDAINETKGKALIIAPKRLWNRIAEHVSLSFIRENNDLDFIRLSERKIVEHPLADPFLQTVLLRFCRLSKSPIVSGLASYLRAGYFKDEVLMEYLTDETLPIRCVDLGIMDTLEDIGDCEMVYFVGCELENRLNQYTAPTALRPADFWAVRSSIPMRLGGTSYTSVTKEERKSALFHEVPKDAAGVWIERTRDGQYLVGYNFNIYKKIRSLLDGLGSSVCVKHIAWTDEREDNRQVFLVRSGKPRRFDFLQKRVNATSRYRSMYWMYQMAFLRDIAISEPEKPIIYLLEDDLEIDKVTVYAEKKGFYAPKEGTLTRKLELIAQRPNGLLVLPKSRFFEVIQKRLYTPYCYVWDQMAVEKHRMMWHEADASEEDGLLNDGLHGADTRPAGSSGDTYQAALLSVWPIYQYYSRFILANNVASKMYIMDSFLEEYHALGDLWRTSKFVSGLLWDSERNFRESLLEAQHVFAEKEEEEPSRNEEAIRRAMDVILSTMVPERDGGRRWTEIQAKVLPLILGKTENYLVSIPTGGGKSVLFQGPALYNASYNNRLSLVITPLKALMKDQVRELEEKGFLTNVDYLSSDKTYQEVRSVYRKINSGELALLYVTPERFRSRAFLNALYTRMTHDKGLEYMIFDEAHCISQWGMEFRPEYLNVIKRCQEFSETFQKGMCIVMFSATVTDMIYNQINERVPVKRLGEDNDRKIYNPIRSHIGCAFQLVGHDMESRVKAILAYIHENRIDFKLSRMLVFCKTRSQTEELAALLPGLLAKEGIFSEGNAEERVGYFHAGMDNEDRDEVYNRFKADQDPIFILCATKAFGMGMDIPNIHYIVHLSPPNVLEDYLQEVGRAGRDKGMYELARFSEDNPIPTVCLFSSEDIKKSREQLLQNMLSWANLEEIRKAIMDYISSIQSLQKTEEYPVVVPTNLWSSGEMDHSYTDFKIGMYWLERMERIKMGYISPAHITLTVHPADIEQVAQFSSKDGAVTKRIYELVSLLSKNKGTSTIQVSLQQIAGEMSIPTGKALNELIACAKAKLLSIDQTVRCRISNTRFDEVGYLLDHPSVELSLHAILNATRSLLERNTLHKERSFFDKEIRGVIDMSSMDRLLKKVERAGEDGKVESAYYMPWYNEKDKQRNKGLSLAGSYKKDLMGKRFRQIFSTLLDITPDVRCKSYIDRENRCVKQSVLIEKNTWKEFLPVFEEDCLETLRYIYRLQAGNAHALKWDEAIIDLGYEKKGFTYFEHILRYLSGMAYIVIDPLLPTGIEVYTTKDSEKAVLDDVAPDSRDYPHKVAFEEAIEIRNLRLCVMDALTQKVREKREFQELISAYFRITDAKGFIELLGKYYEDNDPIWETIREQAIKDQEEKMRGNPEQWAIYNALSSANINVEAGPGSGKTHVLTMRCAKLIYRQHVRPEQILVLAYNRAVVVELKDRLNKLFSSLGLSRSASQIHVYTFHGLAKRVCGHGALEDLEMKEWEGELLDLLRTNPLEVTKVLGQIQYILIDEFQDITETRLEAMFELDTIYNHPAFFTIGDRDQSIYGFEKKESMDPGFFFDELYERLKPQRMSMRINYRSYPAILEAAARFLLDGNRVPLPCKTNIENEPETPYTFQFGSERKWSLDFREVLSSLRRSGMKDVAVFFRTNNEVYNGFAEVKSLELPDIRIRVQGASAYELFRKREIHFVIRYLEKAGDKPLVLENEQTEREMRELVTGWLERYPAWDSFYLDFAFTLVLDFLESTEGSDSRPSYAEMAEQIKQSLAEDNPQLYKLYEKYRDRRLLRDERMNVILTTMHKVKGLEFDAVIITPSVASLPFDPMNAVDVSTPLSQKEREMIEEERRLLYVAYTRAKRYLSVYQGPREQAVLRGVKYPGNTSSLGIRERNPGLDNYNIGYIAGDYGFVASLNAVRYVEKNAPVTIERHLVGMYAFYEIMCNGRVVGQLSKSSTIRQEMERSGIGRLRGFFVSDVIYWSYEDTLRADEKRRKEYLASSWGYSSRPLKSYAEKWCEKAKEKGGVFIVSIAGFGRP